MGNDRINFIIVPILIAFIYVHNFVGSFNFNCFDECKSEGKHFYRGTKLLEEFDLCSINTQFEKVVEKIQLKG